MQNLKSDWRVMALGGVLGALTAFLLYTVLFTHSTAITLLQRGHIIDPEAGEVRVLHYPLTEQIESPRFALELANKFKKPRLVQALKAAKYGGDGGLRAREVAERSVRQGTEKPTLIEITVRHEDRKFAIEIAKEALKHALKLDSEILSMTRTAAQRRIEKLRETINDHEKLNDQFLQRFGSTDQDKVRLEIILMKMQEEAIIPLKEELFQLEATKAPQFYKEPTAFSEAVIMQPLIKSGWVASLLGLLGGLGLGYVVGTIFRRNDQHVKNAN